MSLVLSLALQDDGTDSELYWTMEKKIYFLSVVNLKTNVVSLSPSALSQLILRSAQICQVSFLWSSLRLWDNNNDEIRCGHFSSVLSGSSEKCRFRQLDLVVIHTELVLEIPVFCHWNKHSSYPGGVSGHSQTLFMARVQEDVSQLS